MRPRWHVAVFVLFLALVALYTWPLARDPAHLRPDNHDPRLFTWVMLTIARNLVSQPALLFHGRGSALEALGPRLVELVVGRLEDGLGLELAEFALAPS